MISALACAMDLTKRCQEARGFRSSENYSRFFSVHAAVTWGSFGGLGRGSDYNRMPWR